MIRPNAWTWIAVVLIAFASAPGPRADEDEDQVPTLTTSGRAEVSVAPDVATVRLGATVQAPDAGAAQQQVNSIVRQAVGAIRALGVAQEKIQTAQLTLNPVYGQGSQNRAGQPNEQRVVAYRATNTVQVELEDLSRVGAVIDAGMGVGVNELRGVEFGLRDDRTQRIEALRMATADAQQKARAVAEAAGVTLVAVRSIAIGGQAMPRPQADMRMAMVAEATGAPVLPGQVQVQAVVTMSFRIAPRTGD